MIDVIITTGNLKSAYARLKKYIDVRCDDEGNLLTRFEEAAEHCMTPPTEEGQWVDDVWQGTGTWRFAIRMEPEQADKLPKNDTPNFSTLRSDEEDFVWPDHCGRIA